MNSQVHIWALLDLYLFELREYPQWIIVPVDSISLTKDKLD